MYHNLLTETCDIYHLKCRLSQQKYGAPSEEEYYYDDVPDESDVPTIFFLKNNAYTEVKPGVNIDEVYIAYFPTDTNINYGDKITRDGVAYQVRTPHKPKNHHIEVMVVRMDGQ